MAGKTSSAPAKVARKKVTEPAAARRVASKPATPLKAVAKRSAASKVAAKPVSPRETTVRKVVAERVVAKAGISRKALAKKISAKEGLAKTVLLSGGNPQIAKGYGDAPVQAYIAAMPGWKRDVGTRLDALIERTVPGVRKAVKWNSPLYGADDDGWFLGVHVFTKYVKVAFFRGASLRPAPPGTSRQKDVRYLDIREDDPFDDVQIAAWVKQASQLPGERM